MGGRYGSVMESSEGTSFWDNCGSTVKSNISSHVDCLSQRARFRQDKASELLLTTLTARSIQTLHLALPPHLQSYIQRGPTPPIYTILPPTWYSDRVGRPVGVLTLRHVKRDVPSSNGEVGKDGIREFAWWIAELTRRMLRDWYEGEFQSDVGKRAESIAGGGCVLVVDAKDAGMKNLVFASSFNRRGRNMLMNVDLLP